MPSRASATGSGPFAYYDHVVLPENEKTLDWEIGGRRLRSQVVIRCGSRRRTEAYLFEATGDGWRPATLVDGTVSDGRAETYQRCVEALCGSADTFFTSVFAAQGRRHLSAWRNAEVKALMADLLGLDEITRLGARAAEVVRGLRAGLAGTRQGLAVIDDGLRRDQATAERLVGAEGAATAAGERRRQAAARADAAREALLQVQAAQAAAAGDEQHRAQLLGQAGRDGDAWRRAAAEHEGRRRDLEAQRQRLRQRQQARLDAARARAAELQTRLGTAQQTLLSRATVRRVAQRLPLAERVAVGRNRQLQTAREHSLRATELRQRSEAATRQIEAIEQAAGQASLRVRDLIRRLSLVDTVPCAGTALQGDCRLLGDAREARALRPAADAELARLAEKRANVQAQREAHERELKGLGDVAAGLARAQGREGRAEQRRRRLAELAARSGEVDAAAAECDRLAREIDGLRAESVAETDDEAAERRAIDDALGRLAAAADALAAERSRAQAANAAALAALPRAFDRRRLDTAAAAVASATDALREADRQQLAALADVEALKALRTRIAETIERRGACAQQVARLEERIGDWSLFGRCMSADGLVALAIDEAGPALSALANELLLACYGPRFTLEIRTQVFTVRGEAREGFEIGVHDAASGECKSVGLMSGGERVWINECLTRAVALYLARQSGRAYRTLFSDETDGPLDPDRKRMFIAMKREVLRLGGYRREFFVSQTPELAAMADAVIDLDTMAAGAVAKVPLSA